MSNIIPALVIGAGPVGLVAASELKRHGIKCRIIDQKPGPTTTSNALAVHARSMEMLEDMGLDKIFIENGKKLEAVTTYNKAGQKIASLKFKGKLPTKYSYILTVPQSATEVLLTEHLENEQHITVERNSKLLSIKEFDDHVEATVESDSGEQEIIKARWLLGCDGYHSTVRKFVKAKYEGEDLSLKFIMGDIPAEWPLPDKEISIIYHTKGLVAIFPFKGSNRIIIQVNNPSFDIEKDLNIENFTKELKKIVTFDFKLGEPKWLSHFYVHERLASPYRSNRLFILGDAAHAHSPAGGQGMNTGMQDAYNFAWKLALVIKSQADEKLLDTYEEERRPVAKDVVSTSSKMIRLVSWKSPLLVFIRNCLLKFFFQTKKMSLKLAMLMSALAYGYRDSSLSKDYISTALKAGDRTPDFVKGSHFTLLITDDCEDKSNIEKFIREQCKDLIKVKAIKQNEERYQLYHLDKSYCLVRPDQYIASQGESLENLLGYLKGILNINH